MKPVYSDDFDWLLTENQKQKNPLPNDRLVREMTRGENYAGVRKLAQKYAGRMGISIKDFIDFAGPRS